MISRSREEIINWIVDKIVNDIAAGLYDDEPKIASEYSLAGELNVSRFLVRQAFERLQGLGYVHSKQGIGHFVVQKKISIELPLNSNNGFSSKVKAQGFDVKSEMLLLETITAGADIAEHLHLEPEALVYQLKRIRIVERHIVAIHISYLAQQRFPGLEQQGNIESLFATLKKYQVEGLENRHSLLEVALPTEEEIKIFKCPKLISLISLKGVNNDLRSGHPIEYYEVKYRGDIFKYRVTGG